MMIMIFNLYSALHRAPLLHYVCRCIVKRNVYSADQKDPMLSDGLRRWSGSRFQTIRSAAENAGRPNLLRRWHGTISWWRVADRRRWRLAMSDIGVQQSIKYCGALPCKHRWTITPNLYWTRWGTSNQCSSKWSRHFKPRSNFRLPVTTRAAAFITRWSLSVMFFGDSANTVLHGVLPVLLQDRWVASLLGCWGRIRFHKQVLTQPQPTAVYTAHSGYYCSEDWWLILRPAYKSTLGRKTAQNFLNYTRELEYTDTVCINVSFI